MLLVLRTFDSCFQQAAYSAAWQADFETEGTSKVACDVAWRSAFEKEQP